MNLVFVHDHVFLSSDKHLVYSTGAFPNAAWRRYLELFDELIVVGRHEPLEAREIGGIPLSSGDRVSFVFVESIAGPIRLLLRASDVKRQIMGVIENCHAVVVRLPSENGLLAIAAAQALGKPYAVEVVGCVWDALWNYGSIMAKLYAPIAYVRMRKAVKTAPRCLYVTDEFLQSRYPPNPGAITASASNVEIKVMETSAPQSRVSSKRPVVFGLIGSFKSKYKGLHLALRALAALKNEIGQFELRVLGRGDVSAYSRLAVDLGISAEVVFSGTLPSGDPVLSWLDSVDVYLQPSLQEGLPRALIEAMSRGCVCIGSDVGGIPELLPKQFIHRRGNWKSLAAVIGEVISNEQDWHSISAANYTSAQRYDHLRVKTTRTRFYSGLYEDARLSSIAIAEN